MIKTTFQHPYSYLSIHTKFMAKKDAIESIERKELFAEEIPILLGRITWSRHVCSEGKDTVAAECVYTSLDDAIGQCAKVLQQFGFTLYLHAHLESEIYWDKQSVVEVTITKRELSSKGSLKTFCSVLMSDFSGRIQAKANALFVDSRPKEECGKKDFADKSDTFVVERTIDFDDTPIAPYHTMVTLKEDRITWNDGQGPKNCVHGGVMCIPIFQNLSKQAKEIKIVYKKKIELTSRSIIKLDKEEARTNFYVYPEGYDGDEDRKGDQFSGFAITC